MTYNPNNASISPHSHPHMSTFTSSKIATFIPTWPSLSVALPILKVLTPQSIYSRHQPLPSIDSFGLEYEIYPFFFDVIRKSNI